MKRNSCVWRAVEQEMAADIGWQVSEERLSGVGRLEWAQVVWIQREALLGTCYCRAGSSCKSYVLRGSKRKRAAEGGRLSWRRPNATGQRGGDLTIRVHGACRSEPGLQHRQIVRNRKVSTGRAALPNWWNVSPDLSGGRVQPASLQV